jgi:hypothetical protein
VAHELFFFAQLDPKAGERDHDGDEFALHLESFRISISAIRISL